MKTYLIYDKGSDLIKIGRAVNVSARLKQLQIGCGSVLEVLHVFPVDIEEFLHKGLSEFRIQGEWFNVKKEDVLLKVDSCSLTSAYVNNPKNPDTRKFKPLENYKMTPMGRMLLDQNQWITKMTIGEKSKTPPFMLQASIKKLCKEYGKLSGKRFTVSMRMGQVERVA